MRCDTWHDLLLLLLFIPGASSSSRCLHACRFNFWNLSLALHAGVLRQELTIEYEGEEGEDAGGLRRQFFDQFTTELKASPFWAQTAAGSLRPTDSAVLAAAAGVASGGGGGSAAAPAGSGSRGGGGGEGAGLRLHMETCGRVCGMALYQELHRCGKTGKNRRRLCFESSSSSSSLCFLYCVHVEETKTQHKREEQN